MPSKVSILPLWVSWGNFWTSWRLKLLRQRKMAFEDFQQLPVRISRDFVISKTYWVAKSSQKPIVPDFSRFRHLGFLVIQSFSSQSPPSNFFFVCFSLIRHPLNTLLSPLKADMWIACPSWPPPGLPYCSASTCVNRLVAEITVSQETAYAR